jgi:hypothetical protein
MASCIARAMFPWRAAGLAWPKGRYPFFPQEDFMTIALRHSCRHCRTKLSEPSDNPRRAFCARGCFKSFYRSRCRVCEAPIRRKNEWQKTCIDRKCKAEVRRFPDAYSWPETYQTANHPFGASRASEVPVKWASKSASRPTRRCLREWSWTPEANCELELHDGGDNLLARLEHNDGRYRLTHPRTFPVLSWPDDGEDMAKHRAESIALNSLSLVAGVNIEARELARINAGNGAPHPIGPPLNQSLSREEAIRSDWSPVGDGAAVRDIPAVLLRKVA